MSVTIRIQMTTKMYTSNRQIGSRKRGSGNHETPIRVRVGASVCARERQIEPDQKT
jgi:hypothetical protein